MNYKLGDESIWQSYLDQTPYLLKTSEYEALKRAEIELYGSNTARLAIESSSVSLELQAEIDANMQDFIWKHRTLFIS